MDDVDIPEGAVVRTVRRGSTAGADCASCPFAKNGQAAAPVLGEGPSGNPAWIIVGEGPGHNEVQQGRPFIGASGAIVNKALAQNRRDRSTVWVTNATLCQPRPGADVAAKMRAAKACHPRLQRELAIMPPVPVLALGAVAARSMLPTKLQGITELADTWHAADVDGTGRIRDVIPSIHPAAILHGGGEVKSAHAAELGFWNLSFSVSKVESLSRGKDIRFDFSGIQTEISDALRANQLVVEIYQRALKEGRIGLDLETYVEDETRHKAKQPFVAKIRVLGLATEGFAISVLWSLLSPNAIRLLALILRNPKILKIGQNVILFDRTVFRALGFVVDESWDDTMLMHHAAFPGMGHKLQTVISQFYAVEPWKSDFRAGDDTDENLALYNAKDTLSCRAVTAPLTVWIKRRAVEDVYELDRQCAFVASEMHLHGIPVSKPVNTELAIVLQAVVDRSLADLRAAVDLRRDEIWTRLATQQSNTKRLKDPDAARDRFAIRIAEIQKKAAKKGWQFNPNAPLQVIALLQSLGCVLKKRSKSGRQASTDAEVLEQYKEQPIVRDLISYRERDKLLGTFVLPMFDRLDEKGKLLPGYVEPSGRAHPQWSVHAITGRWRADNPMCYSGDTEILTERGWVAFRDLPRGVKVAQFWKDTGAIDFVTPERVRYQHKGEMVHVRGRYTDQLVTPDHRLLLRGRKSGVYRDVHAGEYEPHTDMLLLHAGSYESTGESLSPAFVTLLCACQADGSWNGSGWTFGLTRQRKIERLTWALTALGLDFTAKEVVQDNPFKLGTTRARTIFYVKKGAIGDAVFAWLGKEKKFGSRLLHVDAATADLVLEEIRLWDGSWATRGRAVQYYSSVAENADTIQALATLCGRRAVIHEYNGSPIQKRPNYQVRLRERDYSHPSDVTVDRIPWDDDVYCVTVPSSYVVVRRNKKVTISGNCQNWSKGDPILCPDCKAWLLPVDVDAYYHGPGKKPCSREGTMLPRSLVIITGVPNIRAQLVAPPGRRLVGFDVAQQEARILALLSDDPFLCSIFSQGKDIHNEFAAVVWPGFWEMPPDMRKALREGVKNAEYASFYGGSEETVHKTLVVKLNDPSITIQQTRQMISLMRSKMSRLIAWQAQLLAAVSRPPHEIRTHLLGRLRAFPLAMFSPADVGNFPIQSFGAYMIKLALVRIMPVLRRYRRPCFPILDVHDAVVFECDENDVDRLKSDVKDKFEQTHKTQSGVEITFPIETKDGSSWAEV